METIMRLSADERAGLIAAAARNLGLGEAIVRRTFGSPTSSTTSFPAAPIKVNSSSKAGPALEMLWSDRNVANLSG